ncbi:SDR family NAD(P)-dependent oxidoreductase [Xinfangfangia sp. CPCC 101601]|uniref:SDR family NAD(P)-dependent oxidoreductase n=1 Tax=Pseudogemmobacter lacusdianii TaxID=3069608 RepID=A0ABU0W1A6_9RHOB|nr:SDR family NAD(P)-dependent oxidoreductase [Xinfangfangia sp. CPCC 101601]MDQ2067789.1 SDR family NAD(P)-dependent oxidoreductase [Xinfangfangia sp. CPCC 101601]
MTQTALPRGRFALNDRVALVTGGASGIGRACAWALVEQGAMVVIADRNAEAADAVTTALREAGHQAQSLALDVTDAAAVKREIAALPARYGSLDILVHSAGVGAERLFLETTAEDWARITDINLNGTFHVAQASAACMVRQSYGRIVLISSVAGLRGGTGRAAYGATKGAMLALGKVMAVELAPYGVTTNMVAPGAIETELVARMHDAKTREAYLSGIPMRRYGTPEEVADTIAFLVSDAAAYVNGVELGIDGGFMAAGVMKEAG